MSHCITCSCELTCMVAGCSSNARTRNMCNKHYTRWVRYGDPAIVHRSGTRILESEYKVKPRDYKKEYARRVERMK